MRTGILLVLAFLVDSRYARASCLQEFREHMIEIFHHGPYEIDGHLRSNQGESRSEVKFIYPNRISVKKYDSRGDLRFGAIEIENRAWRLDRDGHWIAFTGEDAFSLRNQIARGSGSFQMATHVACPDPVPNDVDNYTDFQYHLPYGERNESTLVFIRFDNENNLPLSSVWNWSSLTYSGEDTFKYRFDENIHVDPPTSDPIQ